MFERESFLLINYQIRSRSERVNENKRESREFHSRSSSLKYRQTGNMKPLIANRGLPFAVRWANLDFKVSIWLLSKTALVLQFLTAHNWYAAFMSWPCSTCKRFGQQAWVVAAIVATEILICVKFGWDTLSIPFPFHVSAFWILFVSIWFIWTVWNFWPSIIGVFRVHHDAEDKDAGSVTQNRPKHE